MKGRYSMVLVLCLAMISKAFSQADTLSLQETISKVLEDNYGIRVARLDAEIAGNNLSYGNAGMLPEVTGQGSGNVQRQNTQQQFITGEEINRNNARSSQIGGGVYLQWTLFDGGKMFTTYDKLKELQEMGMLEARQRIEEKVSEVIVNYYDLVRHNRQLAVAQKSVRLSRDRLNLAEKRYDIGKGSRVEKLEARVDLQSDQSRVMALEKSIRNLRVQLNRLMGRSPDAGLRVSDSLQKEGPVAFDSLKEQMEQGNAGLLRARKSEKVAHLELSQLQADRYPELNLESSYNYSRSASEAGFLERQQNLAFRYGFTFSMPLFKGFNLNRQITNARLREERYQAEYQSLLLQTEADLLEAHQNYTHYRKVASFEKEAVRVAQENYKVARKSYEVGSTSSLELREVQQNLLDAEIRYLDALYRLKEAETRLMRLSGQLLDERVEKSVEN